MNWVPACIRLNAGYFLEEILQPSGLRLFLEGEAAEVPPTSEKEKEEEEEGWGWGLNERQDKP